MGSLNENNRPSVEQTPGQIGMISQDEDNSQQIDSSSNPSKHEGPYKEEVKKYMQP